MNPVVKDTQDIRDKMNKIWERVEAKTISAAEAKLQISLARTMLESLKVDIAAAHLAQSKIPSVSVVGRDPPRVALHKQ